MRKPAILSALAALFLAGTLAAQPTAPPERQQRICRAPEKQLGSRIRAQRRCRTAEQWQAEDEGKNGLPLSARVTQGQNDGKVVAQPR